MDTFISMANSSDAYTPEETRYEATRKCLRIFKERGIKLLIITKSNLVTRDIDILRDMMVSVSISITSLDESIARKIEPKAPPPQKRIDALKELTENGIPCSVRLDPIIPSINDNELEEIVREVAPYCEHIVSSTLKPRRDSFKRLEKIFDIHSYKWYAVGNSFYLPKEMRFNFLRRVENACKKYGLTFATCREGYRFNAPSCDGSHLIRAH